MAFVFAQSKAVFFIPAPRAWSRRLQQARPAGAISSRIAARASAAPSRLVGPPAARTSGQVTAKTAERSEGGGGGVCTSARMACLTSSSVLLRLACAAGLETSPPTVSSLIRIRHPATLCREVSSWVSHFSTDD